MLILIILAECKKVFFEPNPLAIVQNRSTTILEGEELYVLQFLHHISDKNRFCNESVGILSVQYLHQFASTMSSIIKFQTCAANIKMLGKSRRIRRNVRGTYIESF